jgi:hypothetical protein
MIASQALAVVLSLVGPPAGGEWGILVMAHGGDAEWNRDVAAVVEPIKQRYPTEIAFGMAQTSAIRDAVQKLEQRGIRRIAVVRMFISGSSFVPATEYILGLRSQAPTDPHVSAGYENSAAPGDCHQAQPAADAGAAAHAGHGAAHGHHMEKPEPIDTKAKFVLSRKGVADSPLIDEILYDRVRALSVEPAKESVLLLAHGPAEDQENEQWLANMQRRIDALKAHGPFREVRCETLREDWPERRAAAEKRIREYVQAANRDGGRCIVIPFRVAGFGPYKEVLEGFDYVADGRGFCPHPNMTRWIEETAKELFAQPGAGTD